MAQARGKRGWRRGTRKRRAFQNRAHSAAQHIFNLPVVSEPP